MSDIINSLIGKELANDLKKTFSEMAGSVKDVDTAMMKLYQSTNETKETYENFLTEANKTAVTLGLSVTSLIEQTSAWADMGYGFSDSAKLAEISALYSRLNDMSGSAAIENIASLMNAFHLAADDISGMTAALSAFQAKAADTSAIETLQKYLSDATGIQISLPTDTDSLTFTYDTLKAVSEIWDELSVSQQNTTLNITGIEDYKNYIDSLMESISNGSVDSSLIASLSSIGTSMQANALFLDTYTGKTTQFESAYQSLANTVTSSPIATEFINIQTKLVTAIDAIVNQFGLIPVLFTAIGAKLSGNVGHNKMLLCES